MYGFERASIALTIRGSCEWKAWVEELAWHCHVDAAGLVEDALVAYAERVGFETPSPDRTVLCPRIRRRYAPQVARNGNGLDTYSS